MGPDHSLPYVYRGGQLAAHRERFRGSAFGRVVSSTSGYGHVWY
jgi:hypothetical protein